MHLVEMLRSRLVSDINYPKVRAVVVNTYAKQTQT